MSKRLVFCLRVRPDDNSPWSEPDYYRFRKARDYDASINRTMAGIRTHSYEEKKTPEEIDQLVNTPD